MPNFHLAQPQNCEAESQAGKDALSVAVAWRKIIWRQAARDEDERIDRLVDVCVRLCDGDLLAGKDLATSALWCPR
jgi:hypothetical protein